MLRACSAVLFLVLPFGCGVGPGSPCEVAHQIVETAHSGDRDGLLAIPGVTDQIADDLLALLNGPHPPRISFDFTEAQSDNPEIHRVIWSTGSVQIPFEFKVVDGRFTLVLVNLELPRIN